MLEKRVEALEFQQRSMHPISIIGPQGPMGRKGKMGMRGPMGMMGEMAMPGKFDDLSAKQPPPYQPQFSDSEEDE